METECAECFTSSVHRRNIHVFVHTTSAMNTDFTVLSNTIKLCTGHDKTYQRESTCWLAGQLLIQ